MDNPGENQTPPYINQPKQGPGALSLPVKATKPKKVSIQPSGTPQFLAERCNEQ